MRYETADNPATPVEVLIELAKDMEGGICAKVAMHLKTPTDYLVELASERDRSLV